MGRGDAEAVDRGALFASSNGAPTHRKEHQTSVSCHEEDNKLVTSRRIKRICRSIVCTMNAHQDHASMLTRDRPNLNTTHYHRDCGSDCLKL